MLLARGAKSLMLLLMLTAHRVLLLWFVVRIVATVCWLALVISVVWVVVRILVDGAQRGGEHLPVLLLVPLSKLMLAQQLGGGPVGRGQVVAEAGRRVLVLTSLPLMMLTLVVANCLAIHTSLLFQVGFVAGGVR